MQGVEDDPRQDFGRTSVPTHVCKDENGEVGPHATRHVPVVGSGVSGDGKTKKPLQLKLQSRKDRHGRKLGGGFGRHRLRRIKRWRSAEGHFDSLLLSPQRSFRFRRHLSTGTFRVLQWLS